MANFQSTWRVLLRSWQLPAIMWVCSCLLQVPGISLYVKNGELWLHHVLPKHRAHTSLCPKELTVCREEELGLYVIYRARLKWTLLFVWSWKTHSEQKAQNKIQFLFFFPQSSEKEAWDFRPEDGNEIKKGEKTILTWQAWRRSVKWNLF